MFAFHIQFAQKGDDLMVSKAQRKSNDKYDAEHMKRLSLIMNIEMFQKMENHIKTIGMKRNKFITEAIREKLERDAAQTGNQNEN